MEYEIEDLEKLVIVSDGTKWNWAEDLYPKNKKILNYFHAKEHLCEFARDCIGDEAFREQWMESTGKALLEKDPEDVMQAVREVVVEGRGAENVIGKSPAEVAGLLPG